MAHDREYDEPYEAPRIEARADIALPLIGGSVVCAKFPR